MYIFSSDIFLSWLETRVDQILIGCTMQLRLLYQSQDRSLKDVIQGYKALLRLLMAVLPFRTQRVMHCS
jgi:hypothetical protein